MSINCQKGVKIMEKNEWTEWKEYSEIEKNNLIKILTRANADKNILISKQTSELVFLNHQLKTRDLMLEKIRELVSDETI